MISSFSKKCDQWSQYSAVILSGMIPISTTGTNIILPVLVLLWFLAGSIQEKTQLIFKHPITKMILIFFGLYVIGSVYSQGPLSDSFALLSKMSKLLYIPFLLPLFSQPALRKGACLSFIGAMLLTLLLSFCKYYEWFPISLGLRHTEACVFKDHIDTNLLMAFAAFLLAHYAFDSAVGKITRYGILLLVGLLTFYIGFMSEGRSGQVIFVALLFTFFIQQFRLKGLLYSVLCIGLLGGTVGLYSDNFQKRWIPQASIQNTTSPSTWTPDVSISQRREFFQHALALANERPWFGFGTGSFKTVYGEHVNQYQLDWKTNNPHGEYLNVYFQLGLMGLLGILALFGILLKISFQLPGLERMFAQGLCVAIGVGCLGNSWLMDFTAGHFFVLFTALCFGAWQKKVITHENSSI